MKTAVELNILLLKFLMLCQVDTQKSSRKENAKFNFLCTGWESKRSWKAFRKPKIQNRLAVGTMLPPPRKTGFITNLPFRATRRLERMSKFYHLDDTIMRVSCKVNALSRITPCMNISKRRIFMNSFFNSQFNYCPLVWMFHSRSINNKINRLHERILRIVIVTLSHLFKISWKKMGLSQYMPKICKYMQHKCLRYQKTFLYF